MGGWPILPGKPGERKQEMTAFCPNCAAGSPLFFRTKDYNRQVTAETFHYYKCSTCGLLFLHPVPGDLGKYYPTDYHSAPPSCGELVSQAEQERYKVDLVQEHKKNGRLLEIGPSWGRFCYLAKTAGFDVEAFERDPGCCRFMNDVVGITAFQGDDICDLLGTRPSYDVITLWHVAEHLPNLWDVLEVITRKLNPGGILVVAAPNPNAWQFRVQGKYWPHVDAPRHVFLIPPVVLSGFVSRMGMKEIRLTTRDPGSIGWNIFGWQHFLSNCSRNRLGKFWLQFVGECVGHCLGFFENREGRGSAYTAIYQKGNVE